MSYKEIIAHVAQDTGLPKSLVDKAYKAYWRMVREHIASLPLKEDLTDEEFLELRPSVNVPSLGKLAVTLDRYKYMKKEHERIIKEKKNVANDES